jgi:MYXO-CTERM domain-containing protein
MRVFLFLFFVLGLPTLAFTACAGPPRDEGEDAIRSTSLPVTTEDAAGDVGSDVAIVRDAAARPEGGDAGTDGSGATPTPDGSSTEPDPTVDPGATPKGGKSVPSSTGAPTTNPSRIVGPSEDEGCSASPSPGPRASSLLGAVGVLVVFGLSRLRRRRQRQLMRSSKCTHQL